MKTRLFLSCLLNFIAFTIASMALAGVNKAGTRLNQRKVIIVIFQKNALNNINKKGTFYTSNNIRYYNRGMQRVDRDLNNNYKNDTLSIYTEKDRLPVDLFYNYITFNYYLKSGDTVLFTFKNDIPIAFLKNRKPKLYDLNYSLAYRKRFTKPLKGSNMIRLTRDNGTKDKLFQKFYAGYKAEDQFLDSLLQADLLSSDVCAFYKNRNRYEFSGNVLVNGLIAEYDKVLSPKYALTALVNNDSLLYDDYFHNFLIWQYLWSDELNINKINNGHGTSLDYAQAYDKLRPTVSNAKVRDYLLFYCLQMIQEEQPAATLALYLKKFRTDVKDTIYTAFINKNIAGNLISAPGHSMLSNLKGTGRIDFNNLLKESRGKIIYVDLWASWCMPCRAALPASLRLKNKYKTKPVTFIYISIDSKFTDWEKGADDEGLSTYKDSYLLIDAKTAALVKQLSIKTIPRYLIYDQTGELVYDNAPGPNSLELEKILDKYLDK